jgi:hypothetical protein
MSADARDFFRGKFACNDTGFLSDSGLFKGPLSGMIIAAVTQVP